MGDVLTAGFFLLYSRFFLHPYSMDFLLPYIRFLPFCTAWFFPSLQRGFFLPYSGVFPSIQRGFFLPYSGVFSFLTAGFFPSLQQGFSLPYSRVFSLAYSRVFSLPYSRVFLLPYSRVFLLTYSIFPLQQVFSLKDFSPYSGTFSRLLFIR